METNLNKLHLHLVQQTGEAEAVANNLEWLTGNLSMVQSQVQGAVNCLKSGDIAGALDYLTPLVSEPVPLPGDDVDDIPF